VRLAVSNLAWEPARHDAVVAELARLGVTALEVAPTKIPAWDTATLRSWRRTLEEAGLSVGALQSLCFSHPEVQLLRDEPAFMALCDHLMRVAEVAAELGAGVAVFGSPANRGRGELTLDTAQELGVARLRCLAENLAGSGMVLALEPVPAAYGCDFLTDAASTRRMVVAVDHPGVRLHLDSAAASVAGDDIAAEIIAGADSLVHFHASQPRLGVFSDPLPGHAQAAMALRQIGYRGLVSVEMFATEAAPMESLRCGVEFVRATYLGA
jgi:D-psicose/D-tagatose/L-ribulose 3-epimerase